MSGTVRDISRFNFFQEANEASKKLRKDSKEFINDVYTKSDQNKMSNKERNRIKKFLKDNDYDPKTGTIKTDIKDKSGKNVRVKFATKVSTDPANKNKLTAFLPDTDDMFPNDPDPGCYIPDPNIHGDESTIVLGKSTLKRKPVISNGNLKHEEGHLAKQVYGKDFSKEERIARNMIDNSHEKMDAHDEDPEEYAVDLYGEKHNKYAKKYPGKSLNSSMSNDVKVLKKNKQTIKKFMTLIKQNASTSVVDDLIMELEQMLSINERMRSNEKDPERQKSYEDENNDLKNTLERIKSINDAAKTKKEYTEYMKRDILRQLSNGSKCIDNGYKLRKQFVQKMINEYALDYDECVELVQEMYNDPEYLLYEIYSESDQDEINEGDEMEEDIDIELPDMGDLKSDFDDIDFDDEDYGIDGFFVDEFDTPEADDEFNKERLMKFRSICESSTYTRLCEVTLSDTVSNALCSLILSDFKKTDFADKVWAFANQYNFDSIDNAMTDLHSFVKDEFAPKLFVRNNYNIDGLKDKCIKFIRSILTTAKEHGIDTSVCNSNTIKRHKLFIEKYGTKPIQEGVMNDIKNGVNPFSDKRIFHVSSQGHLDGQVFNPRVPEYLDKYDPTYPNFEDVSNPRVCFSTSIEGALNAIAVKLSRWKPDRFDKMYVYVPEKPLKEYKHTSNKDLIKDKKVYDANLTKEIWIEEPVRLKLYGVIRVDQVSKSSKKSTVPMLNGKRGDRDYYSFKWHWVVKPQVLKNIPFEYSPEWVCRDMIDDLKGFKYGIPVNGEIKNVSSSDYYDKNYKSLSPEEFEKYKGGICWDYVEWEEGYLKAYGYDCKKYYIFTDTEDSDTHTFITVDDGKGGLIYPESSFSQLEGVHKIKNVEEAIKMIADKMFSVNNNDKKYDEIKYYVWEYSGHPPYGSNTKQCTEYYSKGEPFYEGVAKNKKSDNMSTERVIDDELRSMLKSESVKPKREQPSSLFGRWFMEADDETEENEDIEENDDETEEKDTEEDDDDLEKIDKDFQDLEGFGSDDSDVQNEYDEKEVETLNNLIAAENDAMNDYFDAGKNTNQEILRRLYADIGAEERFHAEQLIYAKCTLTGEKYEPRDPKVKEEYQELLEMGMDEDTAIYTTIDKMSLSKSSDEMTDEDMKDIQEDVATTESMLLQNELILDTILENANFLTNKISEQYESFVEQYVYLEDVSNVSTAPKSLQKGQSPIRFIAKSFSNIIKFLMNLARRIREYMTRSRIKRDKIKRWVKNHGVKAVFEPGYSFYFYNDKTGKFDTNDALRYCDLLFKLTKQIADRCGLSLNFNNPVRINNPIGYGSIERGIELINGVVMSKTKVVITDKNESYFRHVLFGYSDTKIPMIKTENNENGDEVNKLENESFNIYNSFTAILSIISQCSKLTNEVVIAMANLEGDPNSVYRSNYSEYRKMVKNISIVVKGYNTIIKALNADLNTMLKIDNGVLEMTKAHDEADRNGQQWDGGTDDYNPNDGNQQPQQKSQTPHVTPKTNNAFKIK